VTAIVCGSDAMASGAIEGAASLGASVPRDVSVVGHDDAAWAELITPPLTTIRQNVPLMAQSAVSALLGSGEGSRRPSRTELLIRPQLIVRGSTTAAPRRGRSDPRARTGARPSGR
jgi:DNA-binding LacI/PurR family transcriptional regulator